MSTTYFLSDPHLRHRGIQKYRQTLSGLSNDDQILLDLQNCPITKRDTLYILGDVAWNVEGLQLLSSIPGRKILVRGNHDNLKLSDYLNVFDDVEGLVRYKEFWLSHSPIHPVELRGKVNIHGHVHSATLPDTRYFNCCPENLWPRFNTCIITIDQIRSVVYNRQSKQETNKDESNSNNVSQ